ncbi:TPA: hypothetical protein ACF2EG_003694 [Acinetobacter baumannii]|uniref:hypothetical protein n=1 Tax=Acinetobacter sp. C15 TaxID=1661746 RepID=UPI0015D44C0A|nr:hypothetical protein [Acinetobacter sp. C15]
MALKGLKKSEQGLNEEKIKDFIQGSTKRIKKIEPTQQTYKRYTFSLTEDVNHQIDTLLVNCRVAKANRSIILKAAISQLEKLSAEELQKIVLDQIK